MATKYDTVQDVKTQAVSDKPVRIEYSTEVIVEPTNAIWPVVLSEISYFFDSNFGEVVTDCSFEVERKQNYIKISVYWVATVRALYLAEEVEKVVVSKLEGLRG